MAYSLFKKTACGEPQNFPYKIFFDEQYTNDRSRMLRTRPTTSGPSESRSEFAKLEKMLHLIDADCNYEKYRAIIWSIESLNWLLAYDLQYNWSITAPHRFDERTLKKLVESYKPGYFSYATLMMYAKQAGWDEAKWQADDAILQEENAWRDRMTQQEKNYKWTAGLSRTEIDVYYEKLKEKYNKEIAQEASLKQLLANKERPKLNLLSASELKALPQPEYLIKGVLPATGISACYGASGSGKTFLVTDLGINLSLGLDWYEKKSKKCPVTFVVLEGSGGLSKRLQAWEKHFGETIPDTYKVFVDSFSLMSSIDVTRLVEEINCQGQSSGLLVIDTLNQASPGADENSSKDMGLIIQNAQRLTRETKCHVMLVHHTGKDASKGLRGHSSLIAALDVAIEVRRDGSGRSWCIRKSKDDTDEGTHHFDLKQIMLGSDPDGDPLSSCVVDGAIRRIIANNQKKPQGAQQKIAYETFNVLVAAQQSNGTNTAAGLKLEDLVKVVGSKLAVEPKRKTERARAAINGLIAMGLLTLNDGQVNDK
jgi:hypothetical protein